MLGSLNPLPFRPGGGATPSGRAYHQIRRALGTGGTAQSEDGIDALLRRAEAKGLAAASSAKRRAALQAFPSLATDALPYYERALQRVPAPGESPTARRAIVSALWNRRPRADLPRLLEALQRIDTRVSFPPTHPSWQTVTQFGRVLRPLTEPEPAPGSEPWTVAPNFAHSFKLVVLFDVGYAGAMGTEDARIYQELRRALRRLVPSWVDFTLITTTGGFALDVSALGITAMGI